LRVQAVVIFIKLVMEFPEFALSLGGKRRHGRRPGKLMTAAGRANL
jgi:hypothetical protein